MNLNITVNEAPPTAPTAEDTLYNVRAFYTETDAGHLFGPFRGRQAAEACVYQLSARPGVINAQIEEA